MLEQTTDQTWQWLQKQNQLLTMMARGAELTSVLDALNESVESLCAGAICSVMLLGDDGTTLFHAAGARLPEAYVRAINGVTIGPMAGSCGTAAFYKRIIAVSDIAKDPLWEGYRQVALANELRSCWSYPILAEDGSVLGTFGIYKRTVSEPTALELALLESFAPIAGIALEREQRNRTINQLAYRDRYQGWGC